MADNLFVDASALSSVAAASGTSYRSFADATRSMLELLARLLPETTVFLAHLDRTHNVHRVVDVRGDGALELTPNQTTPLRDSLCGHMVEGAPRLCNDVVDHPVYGGLGMQRRLGAGSYLGVPLELSDGVRVGSLAAISPQGGRFRPDDEQILLLVARVLGSELERESNARDVQRLNGSLRDHARGMGAIGRVARVLASGEDARRSVCRAACEIAGAPIAFLLEPSGRDFVSTAMTGIDLAPVTITPRADTAGRAFTARESYFVSDARTNPAVADGLVEATGAQSALFEPVLRDDQVAGVLILIWQEPIESVPEAVAGLLRVLAAQAAVTIEHVGLRSRMESLALSDPLTGVAARRLWDDELTRELARARRNETPLSVAVLDLDHLGAFNLERGEREGDRLIKETASLWRGELREVDLLARLEGGRFGLVLPGCGLGEAIDVLDRVRAATPRGQTGSAGVARWDGEESVEMLVARVEDALVAAKGAGRDLTIAAD